MRDAKPVFRIEVDQSHVDKDFPPEWYAIQHDGTVFVVDDSGEGGTTVYALDGATDNPRVIAQADAILWEGTVGLTGYEGGFVYIQHRYAGVQEELIPGEFLDEPVPTLKRTEMVSLEGER